VVDRYPSYVEGSTILDFLFVHYAWLPGLLKININDINRLKFYHYIRGNLAFSTARLAPGVLPWRSQTR